MVSCTRCPAWSDKLKNWSESRAAAPKDRCPVGHRGEFPYVLIGQDFGLRGHISGQRGMGDCRGQRSQRGLKGLICGLSWLILG